jgi:hypothetical protein
MSLDLLVVGPIVQDITPEGWTPRGDDLCTAAQVGELGIEMHGALGPARLTAAAPLSIAGTGMETIAGRKQIEARLDTVGADR